MKINNQIKEIERDIEFFGGKDFEKRVKDKTMGEIIEDEGLFIAWGKSVKLDGYKQATKQFQKEIKELQKFIEYNVRFERNADYHKLMDEIKKRFGD